MVFENAHINSINCIAVMSPNIMCTASFDGIIKIWDISEKNNFLTFQNNDKINKLLKVDDRILAVASGKFIYFWDWANKS